MLFLRKVSQSRRK